MKRVKENDLDFLKNIYNNTLGCDTNEKLDINNIQITLKGDATFVIDGNTLLSRQIYSQAQTESQNGANKNTIANIRNGYYDSLKFANSNEDFNRRVSIWSENGYSGTPFSVLVLDTDSSAELNELIENYLDLITNGGAKKYKALNNSRYTVDISTYKLTDNRFVKQPLEKTTMVYNSGSSGYMFNINRGKKDSDENQFTLLSFSFTNGDSKTLVVQIPVFVDKPLEVTITINQVTGSAFIDETYNNQYEVLSNYNAKSSARIEYAYNYNWSDLVYGNGDNANWYYTKAFKFSNSIGEATRENKLPIGTRITLIDVLGNDKSYTNKVSGQEMYELNLNTFFGWTPRTFSDLIYSEAITDENFDGEKWVKDSEAPENYITVANEKYRLKTEEDTGTTYTIKCKNEVFILVIETPKVEVEEQIYRNISFQTGAKLSSGGIANGIKSLVSHLDRTSSNQLKIYKNVSTTFTKKYEKINNETQISGNYVELKDQDNVVDLQVQADFSGDTRLINDNMTKYLQFVIRLDGQENGSNVKYLFENALDVEVNFDIYNGKNLIEEFEYDYYTNDGDSLNKIVLPFKDNEDKLINIIDYMKNIGSQGSSQDVSISVIATIRIKFKQGSSMESLPVATIINDGVPNQFASLNLSVEVADNTRFTSKVENRLSIADMYKYYVKKDSQNSLSYITNSSIQLGINVGATNEPVNGNATIDTTAIIDCESFLEYINEYDSIEFTFSLSKKNNAGEYVNVSDISKYIEKIGSETVGEGENFFITQSLDTVYYDENTNQILIPIGLSVKRLPIDSGFIYTSYKLSLVARIYKSDKTIEEIQTNEDHIIYLIAKISEGLVEKT